MTAAVKERPILFSAPMIRAILDDRKTQTRRVVKPAPPKETVGLNHIDGTTWACIGNNGPNRECPYGSPGDRLWVRESWALRDDVNWRTKPDKAKHYCLYRQGYEGDLFEEYHRVSRWRSGRFMPRVLSRITLEITDVRVQRVQDISREDEIAEATPDGAFFDSVWDSINAKRCPWASNPWVWCLSFRKIDG